MECDTTCPLYTLPGNPFTSPARRWLRARWLHARRERTSHHFDDGGVSRVLKFLRAAGDIEHGQISARAKRLDPTLAEALRLYRNTDPALRGRLEAYLLTEVPMESVAAHCLIGPEVAQVYHDVFFEVGPRREATDWVWMRAIRAGPWNGFGEDYPASLWKGVAYSAGPLALELVVSVTNGNPFQDGGHGPFRDDPVYEQTRMRYLGKLVVAAMTADCTRELAKLIEAREQLRNLDRLWAKREKEPSTLLIAMEGFLKSVDRRKYGRHTHRDQPIRPGGPTAGPTRAEKTGRRDPVDLELDTLQ